jgi:toxin YoeB
MRNVDFTAQAFSEFQEWVTEDLKITKKIIRLISECQKTPFHGTGKPEPLKGAYKGLWSRRITDEHRLVYAISEDKITILACRTHYETL